MATEQDSTRSLRRLSALFLAAVVFLLGVPVFAGSPTVSARFFNSIDITGFDSCTWGEGRPAPNHEVEEAIRDRVESVLKAKGYTLIEASRDCRITSQAIREGNVPIGMLVIEVHAAKTNTLAWRGEATGLVNYSTKQLKKKARKVVKTMFQDFPTARQDR